MQLLSTALSSLALRGDDAPALPLHDMEWETVLVFSCTDSCGVVDEELVWVC
jgi:hypothetical protein